MVFRIDEIIARESWKLQRVARCSQPKPRLKTKDLFSCGFWKILNRGKMSVPTIINELQFILSAYQKTRLFAMNFAFNSTLDYKDHPFPDRA